MLYFNAELILKRLKVQQVKIITILSILLMIFDLIEF